MQMVGKDRWSEEAQIVDYLYIQLAKNVDAFFIPKLNISYGFNLTLIWSLFN